MPDPVVNLLIVAYELADPLGEQNLGRVVQEASTAWWHHLECAWIIRSHFTAVGLRDHLRPALEDNDRLFVADISESNVAWRGFSERGASWLTNNVS